MIRLLFITFLSLILFDCAPTRFVEPLHKGQKAVGLNFGGPVIDFAGATIPIPFTSVYGGYGLTRDLTLYTGLHLTAAAYKTLQLDLGATYRLLPQYRYRPSVGMGAAINSITALPSGVSRFFPQIDLHMHWDYAAKWRTYLGASSWLDFYSRQRQSKDTYRLSVFNFYMGQTFKLSKQWELNLEYKWLDPWDRNDRTVVHYVHWSDKGAQGLYFNVIYKW